MKTIEGKPPQKRVPKLTQHGIWWKALKAGSRDLLLNWPRHDWRGKPRTFDRAG